MKKLLLNWKRDVALGDYGLVLLNYLLLDLNLKLAENDPVSSVCKLVWEIKDEIIAVIVGITYDSYSVSLGIERNIYVNKASFCKFKRNMNLASVKKRISTGSVGDTVYVCDAFADDEFYRFGTFSYNVAHILAVTRCSKLAVVSKRIHIDIIHTVSVDA